MKKYIFRILAFVVLVLPIYLTFLANHYPVRGIQVTNLKDQLSSAQLSFFGRLSNYSGSLIKLQLTGGSAPSLSSFNLAAGDTLAIANSGVTTVSMYTVRDIGDTSTIELSSAIGTTTPNSYIVATRSAIHTVYFTPKSYSVGESWLFLIKVTDRSGEKWNDGIPDQTGFDFGGDIGSTTTGLGTRLKTADVTCPFGGSASVGNTLVITSGASSNFLGSYGIVQCPGSGTSTIDVGSSFVIGRALTTGSQLINPSPGLSHTIGQANSTSDTIAFGLRQIDGFGAISDTTFGKLAVTESVRVTATVEPTITFIIDNGGGVSVGSTVVCGTAIGTGATDTTAASVSFGPLSLGAFNNLAQRFRCTTNATNGYVVQAYENRQMTMIGSATTIPDTNCEGGSCTASSGGTWSGYNNSGFGYSLQSSSIGTGTTMAVTSGSYRPFGAGSANAQTLMSRTSVPSQEDSAFICYRVTASTYQPAGDYETSINFIATATF